MVSLRAVLQGKERESIPLRARHMPGHRAQRLVYALLIAKAFFQHLHGYALLVALASEPGAGRRADVVACYRRGTLVFADLSRPKTRFP